MSISKISKISKKSTSSKIYLGKERMTKSKKSSKPKNTVPTVLAEMKGVRVRREGKSPITLIEYVTGVRGNPRTYYAQNAAKIEKRLLNLKVPTASKLIFANEPKSRWAKRSRATRKRLSNLQYNARLYKNTTVKGLRTGIRRMSGMMGLDKKDQASLVKGLRSMRKHELRDRLMRTPKRRSFVRGLVAKGEAEGPLMAQIREGKHTERQKFSDMYEERKRARGSGLLSEIEKRGRGSVRVNYSYDFQVTTVTSSGGVSDAFTPRGFSTDGFIDIDLETAPVDVQTQVFQLVGLDVGGFNDADVSSDSPIGRFVEARVTAAVNAEYELMQQRATQMQYGGRFTFRPVDYDNIRLVLRPALDMTPFESMGFSQLKYDVPEYGSQKEADEIGGPGVHCFVKGILYFIGGASDMKRYNVPFIQGGLLTACGIDLRKTNKVTPLDIVKWSKHPDGGRDRFSHTFLNPLEKRLDCSYYPKKARINCVWILKNGHYNVAQRKSLRDMFSVQHRKKYANFIGSSEHGVKLVATNDTKVVELNCVGMGPSEILDHVSEHKCDVVVVHAKQPKGEISHTGRCVPMVEILLSAIEKKSSFPEHGGVSWVNGSLRKIKMPGMPLIMEKDSISSVKELCTVLNDIHSVRKRHWLCESVSSLFFEFISCCGDKGGVIPSSILCPRSQHMFVKYYARAMHIDYRAEDPEIANFGSPRTLALDFNKAYSNSLAAPEDRFAQFIYLDQPVVYEPNNPDHNRMRDCWIMLNKQIRGRMFMHASMARSLFDVKELRHMDIAFILIPSYSYDRDTYADSMRKWFNLGISDRVKKDGPNHWVGTQTKRFGRKVKYTITDHYNEYEALLRDHPAMKVRQFGSLYYCYLEQEWILPKTNNPLAFQVIDQTNGNGIRLEYLYKQNNSIRVLGIKSDCVFGHIVRGARQDILNKIVTIPGATHRDGVTIIKDMEWDPVSKCKTYAKAALSHVKYIGEPIKRFEMGVSPGQLKIETGVSRYTSPYEEELIDIDNKEFKAGATLAYTDRETIQSRSISAVDRYRPKPWRSVSRDDIIADFKKLITDKSKNDEIVKEKREARAELLELAGMRLRDKETRKMIQSKPMIRKIREARAELKRQNELAAQKERDAVTEQNAMTAREKYDLRMDKLLPNTVRRIDVKDVSGRVVPGNEEALRDEYECKRGGFIDGLPGTAKSRLLCEMENMAAKAGVATAVFTFKGASSNNLNVKGVDCKTIDSFLSTKLNEDPKTVLRLAIKKLRDNGVRAILVDEYGEIPIHHMTMLLKLSEHFPMYIFGDHEQACPGFQKRLYEYRKLETFKRMCGYRHAHLEYKWTKELIGKQRCPKKTVNAMNYLRERDQLQFGRGQAHFAIGCTDEEKRGEKYVPSTREWIKKTPIVSTLEYFPVHVIEKILAKDWTTCPKHKGWRIRAMVTDLLQRTDYKIYDHHGVKCYRQTINYFENGVKGSRIYSGDGTYQGLKRELKSLFLHGLYYDFDQGASHQCAVENICRNNGIACPTIDNYIKNYSTWRKEVADYYTNESKGVYLPIDGAKRMFTAITYGSSLNSFGLERSKRSRNGRTSQHTFFDEVWGEGNEDDADAFAKYYSEIPVHKHLVALKRELHLIARKLRGNEQFEKFVSEDIRYCRLFQKKTRDHRIRALCTWAQMIEREITLSIMRFFGKDNCNGLIHDGLHVLASYVDERGGVEEMRKKCRSHVIRETGYLFILKVKPFDITKARAWMDKIPDLATPSKIQEFLPLNHIVKFNETGRKWNQRIMDALVGLADKDEPMMIIGNPVKDVRKNKRKSGLQKWQLPGYKLIKGMRITTRDNMYLDNLEGERVKIHNAAQGIIRSVTKCLVVDWNIGAAGTVTTFLESDTFFKRCQLDYAVTTERVQGRTINESVWIWNTRGKGKHAMSKNELLMSMSRCKQYHQLNIEKFYHRLEWRKMHVLPTPETHTKVFGQIWTYPGMTRALFRIVQNPKDIKKITPADSDAALKYKDVGRYVSPEVRKQRAEQRKIILTEKPQELSRGYFASEVHLLNASRSYFAVYKKKETKKEKVVACKRTSFKRSKMIHCSIDKKRHVLNAYWWVIPMNATGDGPEDKQKGGKWTFAAGPPTRHKFAKRFKKMGLAEAEALLLSKTPARYKIHRKNYDDPNPADVEIVNAAGKKTKRRRNCIQFVRDADGRYFPSTEAMEGCLAAERNRNA